MLFISVFTLILQPTKRLESFIYNTEYINKKEEYFNIDYDYYENISNEYKLAVIENFYTEKATNSIDNKVVVNLNGEILDEFFTRDGDIDFIPIKDFISGYNLYYAKIIKDESYDSNDTNTKVKIFDAKNDEIIIHNPKESAVPVCSIGNYLIYENNQDGKFTIEAYTTTKEYIPPIKLIDEDFNSKDNESYNESYIDYDFICKNKKIFLIYNEIKYDNNNEQYLKNYLNISYTHIYEYDLINSKFLPYAYENTINVDGDEYLLVYKKIGADNAKYKSELTKTYNLIKPNLDYTVFSINMGENVTFIDIDNIENSICKIKKNGVNYTYNIVTNSLINNLDKNTSSIIYKRLRKNDKLYDAHYFDDGVLMEIKNGNEYRLINEYNLDIGIYSYMPILMGFKSKKTKNSMFIREVVFDEEGNERRIYRTLDKNIFPGIYEDEYETIKYYTYKEIWDRTNIRVLGFLQKDGSFLDVDLLFGTKYINNNNADYYFPIGDEIYFRKNQNSTYKIYNIKTPDTPTLTLDLKKEYYQQYCFDDLLIITDTNDDNLTNNTTYFINKNLDVISKNTYYKLGALNHKMGDKYFYQIEYYNYDKTIYYNELYDDNFNLIQDNIINLRNITLDEKDYLSIRYKKDDGSSECITIDSMLNRINNIKDYLPTNYLLVKGKKYILLESDDEPKKSIIVDENFNTVLSYNNPIKFAGFNDYVIINKDKSFEIEIYDKNFNIIKTIDLMKINKKLDENENNVIAIYKDTYHNYVEIYFEGEYGHKPNNIIISKNLKAHIIGGQKFKYIDGIYINDYNSKIYLYDENFYLLKTYESPDLFYYIVHH